MQIKNQSWVNISLMFNHSTLVLNNNAEFC